MEERLSVNLNRPGKGPPAASAPPAAGWNSVEKSVQGIARAFPVRSSQNLQAGWTVPGLVKTTCQTWMLRARKAPAHESR